MSQANQQRNIFTRRAVLAGSTAVALAAAPVVAAAAVAGTDLHVAWWAKHQEIEPLMNAAYCRADDAYQVLPEELRAPCVLTGRYRKENRNGPRAEGELVPIYAHTEDEIINAYRSSIAAAACSGSEMLKVAEAHRDAKIAELRQKIAIRDASPAWIEYSALQAEFDRLTDRYFALESLIAETPTRTPEGLRIQIGLLRDYIGNGDEVSDKLARSLCVSFGVRREEGGTA